MPRKTSESYVKKAVMDYLAAKKIFFLRMNSGQMLAEYKARTRRIAMGEKGTADLLALPVKDFGIDIETDETVYGVTAYWLECKAEGGKQTPAQKDFQARVEAEGHRYAIVKSIDDVKGLGL